MLLLHVSVSPSESRRCFRKRFARQLLVHFVYIASRCFVTTPVVSAVFYPTPQFLTAGDLYRSIGITLPTKPFDSHSVVSGSNNVVPLWPGSGYAYLRKPSCYGACVPEIKVAAEVVRIYEVDDQSETIDLKFNLIMSWRDTRLAWNTSKTNPKHISFLTVPEEILWLPDQLILAESREYIVDNGHESYLLVNASGQVFWYRHFYSRVHCTLDPYRFPFDSHKCALTFSASTYRLQVEPTLQVTIRLTGGAAGWHLGMQGAAPQSASYRIGHFGMVIELSRATFTFVLERAPLQYVMAYVVPPNLMALIGQIGVFYASESSDRFAVGCSIIVAQTLFVIFTAQALPPSSKSFPVLGVVYNVLYILVCLATLVGGVREWRTSASSLHGETQTMTSPNGHAPPETQGSAAVNTGDGAKQKCEDHHQPRKLAYTGGALTVPVHQISNRGKSFHRTARGKRLLRQRLTSVVTHRVIKPLSLNEKLPFLVIGLAMQTLVNLYAFCVWFEFFD